MNFIEQPETSMLPVRVGRVPQNRPSGTIAVAAIVFAMSNADPSTSPPSEKHPPILGLGVDPDYSFALTRLQNRQTFITRSFGSESTLMDFPEEAIARQSRRVSLIKRKRSGQLSAAEVAELQRLQADEDTKLEAELQPSIDRLRRLLHS